MQFAEMGLLAAPFSEDVGGLGGGAVATMIVMQEFGRNLVVEPYFETVVLAGGLIEDAGTDAQREEYLPPIMGGEAIWALAWTEGHSRYDLNNVGTSAKSADDGYVLNGAKAAVIGAPWADKLIVSARTSGNQRDREGISLFVVDRQSAGVHLQSFQTIDGRRAAEILLKDVHVPASALLGEKGSGVAALEACRDRAIAALCAEATGAMTELNSATLEYSKTRKQFGVPLGTLPGPAAPDGRYVHRARGGDIPDAAPQSDGGGERAAAVRSLRPAQSRRSVTQLNSSANRRSSSMAAWA